MASVAVMARSVTRSERLREGERNCGERRREEASNEQQGDNEGQIAEGKFILHFERGDLNSSRAFRAAHGAGKQALRGGFGTCKFTGYFTCMQHENAIAHPDQFRQFARDEHDRLSFAREPVDDLVDFDFRSDVDAASWLIEKNDGSQRSAFPKTTFC